jgi:putative heme-binding domain-containing protein
MYAVHLEPRGATYEATSEVFVQASPFPITDSVINPKDGAMYFALGGRNVISGLYRIVYTGDAERAVDNVSITDARVLRRAMEQFHGRQDPVAVAKAWPLLDHEDRFVRYAARIAIEHQPVEQWQDRIATEARPWAIIESVVALARHGGQEHCGVALEALGRLDGDNISREQFLAALRALNLVFIRLGQLEEQTRLDIIEVLDPLFPQGDPQLDMELARTMVYLNADGAVGKTLELLQNAASIEEQVHYAYCLRVQKDGWTMNQRRAYYEWFAGLGPADGGASFKGFIQNIKVESMKMLSDADRAALKDVIAEKPAESISVPLPQGPGKDWTVDNLIGAAQTKMKGRDYDNGKKMFAAGLCFMCHRFDRQGGAVGPDLTGVGNRFTEKDTLEAIIEPSKVVSDQYAATKFTLKNGQTVIGRVANLSGDNYMVLTNMYNPNSFTNVNHNSVKAVEQSDVSMMPEDLVNRMNEQEILDLLAYLKSGGDPGHEVFKE